MTDCIEWTGSLRKDGYGRIWQEGPARRSVLAHRQVMADIYGWDALEGRDVMHLCNNPPCVNPEHLRIGTHQENMQMAMKLTARQVVAIRHMHRCGMAQKKIAEFFGVSNQQINKIVRGLQWRMS